MPGIDGLLITYTHPFMFLPPTSSKALQFSVNRTNFAAYILKKKEYNGENRKNITKKHCCPANPDIA
jgi:hypothetical protein